MPSRQESTRCAMSDSAIGRMLRRAGDEPNVEFVAKLRRDLLTEFPPAGSASAGTPPTDDVGILSADTYVAVLEPSAVRHRPPLWLVLTAAAIAAAVIATGIALTTRPPRASVTSTPSEEGFSLQLSTDVKTSDGYGIHFEGTLQLSQAVESNELSSLPLHDVLLIPKINGSFTNSASGRAAPLSLAYVELFLNSDAGACVANASGCEDGITRAQNAANLPTVLAPGGSLSLADVGQSSRINVPADDVQGVIEEVRTGTIVTGGAVVVAGATANEVTSMIFDRTGKVVASCNSLPADCMDPARSVLGPDAAPARSVPAGVPALPTAEAAAGAYSTTVFRVPLTLTASGRWEIVNESNNAVLFGRSAGPDQRVSQAIVIAIEPTSPAASTADQILTSTCPESVDFGPAKAV